MSVFTRLLSERNTDPRRRRWLFVPYDQLTDAIGPLSREDPRTLGIVLVESKWKAGRRPYHRQKLALVLANIRHFALEQAERGVAVRHVVSGGLYRDALRSLVAELGPMRVMLPAERELRVDLQPLFDTGAAQLVPHEGWLTSSDQFRSSQPAGPPWRMDAFYRYVRRQTGILMQDGKPVGGKFSFDPENRRSWRGDPPAPQPPAFPRDPVKDEVGELIEGSYRHHPGLLDLDALPGTAADAETLWAWAKENCLHAFGPYEDAMSTLSSSLFHTRISSLLNIHRLLPARVVRDVETMTIPLASKEGFIRQVLGWREFVRHTHVATDGFRVLPGGPSRIARTVGDGGYAAWSGEPWPSERCEGEPDGGAEPSALGSHGPLPPAFWGARSGLECLDRAVADVWRKGYSHHIVRLMVLCNVAALLDVSPRSLTDWFWLAYTDAYDWVVEPNVLGMGTYGVGDLMTTKPYVAGAAYINRMSDYCQRCEFDPKTDCAITGLYWAFLARHQDDLAGNRRLALGVKALGKRDDRLRRQDAAVFQQVRKALMLRQALSPTDLPG